MLGISVLDFKSVLCLAQRKVFGNFYEVIVEKPNSSGKSYTQMVRIPNKIPDKTYNIRDGVVSFSYDKRLYVIPQTTKVMDHLMTQGFKRDERIPVLYYNGVMPANAVDNSNWKWLMERAAVARRNEFIEFCCNLDPKHEHLLFSDATDLALEIPEEGIAVYLRNGKLSKYLPVINGNYNPEQVKAKIFRYNHYNNVCIYTYRNGKTYVHPNAKALVPILEEKGYQRAEWMDVPFASQDETIVDEAILKLWENLVICSK